MSRYRRRSYWRTYVTMAEREDQAAQKMARLRKQGREVSPIELSDRRITTTFWGKAWCDNLEAYSDYSNRLPRGRTYVRNGSVIDLQVEPGRIRSLVSGSEIYEVAIGIKKLPQKRWAAIKNQCMGGIGSLVELLSGVLSSGVMEVVTQQGEGLFPAPREISLSCSCPDWATMCKHVAATLYGVGARLDQTPELLFTLRGVDPTELVETAIDQPAPGGRPARGKVLSTDELSSVFGVEIDTGPVEAPPVRPRRAKKRAPRKQSQSASAAARPEKPAKLSRQALERLQDRALDFAMESDVLRESLQSIEVSRGRLYLRRPSGDLQARITPLSPRSMLLESPRGRSWIERGRGSLGAVLRILEEDARQ